MSLPYATELAIWSSRLAFQDLPEDVVKATKLRVLDSLGLALAGAQTDFGRSVRNGVLSMARSGSSRLAGTGECVGIAEAALVNASFIQALEFDDTHNESIVHMSGPSIAAALALAETIPVSGRDFIMAVALGNEISCRIGSVSGGDFHRRGFHPTGLFTPFGVAYLACRLLELDVSRTAHAAGTCGSFASGILECWVDGTQTKFIHSGWAAQSGILAAFFARAGVSGPAEVFEGRFGLFASHLQMPSNERTLARMATGLGSVWESRNSSFKPFPAAHVIHPYIDALLRVCAKNGVRPENIDSIDCPVANYIIPIVCEPVHEKLLPASDSQARVSLQYTLAEALHFGKLDKGAYRQENLRNPEIVALAKRVLYHVDPDFPRPGRFKGAVEVRLKDGRVLDEVEEYNRGSPENPMAYRELRDKFDENASGFLSRDQRDELAGRIEELETLPNASVLLDLCCKGKRAPEGALGA